MASYEYRIEIISLPADNDELTDQMNEIGAEGWKLVLATMVNDSRLWFIREVQDDTPELPEPPEPPDEVTGPPIVVDEPYASGPSGQPSAAVGEVITCTMGNWENEPNRRAYLWKRRHPDGHVTPLENETEPEYTAVELDRGNALFCAMEASNDFGQAHTESNDVTVTAETRRR